MQCAVSTNLSQPLSPKASKSLNLSPNYPTFLQCYWDPDIKPK
uniref:Uncharacterized protein n=1 Tax=Rhizophora mucronata TaxID=61149 RepID=A0A2P2Q9W8_RHIMU